ncbi:S8 family peptidase [Natronoglycomyces albus]|uniref:S8 family serine peptidase n=1 Tax=Natronoglycomyces albus TaxID=2811108 RepID=A0A895XI10_9ACTN|nr:S8 family peptidase [Natronoglycomyces albus]QSB04974.1 S8 family serine peptidase [Natronoglycomyces albus]
MSTKKSLRRSVIAVASAGAIAVGTIALATSPAQAEGNILGTDHPNAIEGSYLVTLESDVSIQSVDTFADTYGAEVTSEWTSFNGFAAEMTEAEAKKLAADPAVKFVEQDAEVHLASAGVQPNPPAWGIDRVDQRNLPLDGQYAYPNQGTGVTQYILDTGVYLSHSEFTGRMVQGFDAINPGGNANDCHGHGTHVAGSAAGTLTGVAKNSYISPVRVLNCQGSGSFAGIIDGINWVSNNASGPSVANMSLGGGYNATLNQAVASGVAAGVTYVVASGNSNANACNYSPASEATAITVNSSTRTDARSGFSNWGTCSDIFAPGSDIYGPWIGGNNAFRTISGTSMASPHVSGAAALYLASNPSATPAQVKQALTSNATQGVISNPGSGSPNRLLYVGFIDGGPGEPEDEFSVSVSPDSAEIEPGDSVTATLSTETTSGDAQEVTLSHSGAGSDVTVDFADSTLTTGESTQVTFSASSNASDATHSITLTASGNNDESTTFTLTVGDEPVEPPPGDCVEENNNSQTIHAGWLVSSNILMVCDDAGSTATINVDVTHSATQNLEYYVFDPAGQVHLIKPRGQTDSGTYTINAGSAGWGYYTLIIFNYGNSGTLNGWSVEV